MDNLIFINVCPHDPYFLWQEEVLINNFRKFNISDKMEILVWYTKDSPHLIKWRNLQAKYPEVAFYFYEDEGVDLGLYIPQLRPHTLKKHFRVHQDRLKDKVFFYHDSDILFTYLPDFENLIKDDICWQSDTSGYLDYNYLRRKEIEGKIPENEAVQVLAEIGNVTVGTFQIYAGRTGGAQCILKNIDYSYWDDVERMCLEIRRKFFWNIEGSVNHKYFPSESAGFQSWCADMWAVNMGLWSRGIRTDITKELDFSWATDSLETFKKKPIYHNAGVASPSSNLFYKGSWIHKSPIGVDLPLPPEESASRQYVLAIKDIKQSTELFVIFS